MADARTGEHWSGRYSSGLNERDMIGAQRQFPSQSSPTGEGSRSPSFEGGCCNRTDCLEKQEKLKDAMQANRSWERRFNELFRESRTYTQDLERQLRDRQREAAAGSSPSVEDLKIIADLQREIHEQRESIREFRRTVSVLDRELRSARAQVHQGQRHGHQAELEIMRQQLAAYKDDFEKEKAERLRVEAEKDKLREQIVRAQQVSATNQENYLAARREKEELQTRVLALTGTFGVGRQTDHYSRNGPMFDHHLDFSGDEEGHL